MIWPTLGASLFHPVALAVLSLVVALGCGAEHAVLGRVTAVITLFGIPVLAASCITKAFYQWCFGELARGHRSVPLLTAVWTGCALLGDELFVSATGAMWARETIPMTSVILVLTQATAYAVTISAAIMLAVLLVELPVRWVTSAFGVREAQHFMGGVRWIGAAGAISIVWILIVELSRTTLLTALEGLPR